VTDGPTSHRSFRIEVERGKVHAVCACGWRSQPALNAGMAGALWDRHRADVDA
jgi:hypothetical protein